MGGKGGGARNKGGVRQKAKQKGGMADKQRAKKQLVRQNLAGGIDVRRREKLEKLVDERRNAGSLMDGMVDDDWRSGRYKNGSAAAVPDEELAAEAAAADEAAKAAMAEAAGGKSQKKKKGGNAIGNTQMNFSERMAAMQALALGTK